MPTPESIERLAEDGEAITAQQWDDWLYPRPTKGITQEQMADFMECALPCFRKSPLESSDAGS
jgi:hypothetical protein